MKRILILILPILFFGCEELAQLTQFNMPYDTSITISTTTQIDLPIDIGTPPITTNAESTFSANGTNPDLIEEIKLTELVLTVVDPASGDFGFLKEITIYIDADGLSEVEIASSGQVSPSAGAELSLTTTDVDLKEYLKKDSFSLRISVTTDEAITEDHDIRIDANFFVDAKILGL